MEKTTYNIGVFDDHPIITDAVKTMLQGHPSLKLTIAANTKDDLLKQLSTNLPDAMILDVVAPDVNGLELYNELRILYPTLKLLAYTTLSSVILIENILMSGAQAYINKRQKSEEVITALLQVCKGGQYVPEQYSFLLKKSTKTENSIQLTKREQEVLELILDGKLSKEIAEILFISQNTVENHRTNLFKKFQVSNLAELIKQAARLGYTKD